MNDPQSLPERILQAGLEQRGLGPNASQNEIREFFKDDWNNSLKLTIFAEHATGLLRDVLTRRIKALDRRKQLIQIIIAAALVLAYLAFSGHFRTSQPGIREYYAWERTPQGQYKQVRKNYFMSEELCKNVINVLNEMSTMQPHSNYTLSHTTDSTFECWPADAPPSPRLHEFSIHSD